MSEHANKNQQNKEKLKSSILRRQSFWEGFITHTYLNNHSKHVLTLSQQSESLHNKKKNNYLYLKHGFKYLTRSYITHIYLTVIIFDLVCLYNILQL